MNTWRRDPIPFLTVLLLLAAAACDEEDPITGPAGDVDPPSVILTSVPAKSQANQEVLLEFEVTDDVALESAVIDWGGHPWGGEGGVVNEVPLEGTSSSVSRTHIYPAGGQFRIFVQVRDRSGRTAGATHPITITEHAPEAPADLTVEVRNTGVTLRWTPGAWAERQEITVSRRDAPDAELIREAPDPTTATLFLTGLAWDAEYTAVVVAENPWGRAVSAQVAFRTPAPDPPLLKRFSAEAADPTCLVLEWSLGAAAENYRVAVTGSTEGDSFEELLPSSEREVQFCAAMHPIVDGTTYTAQVLSVLDSREYGSNTLEYTVDFHPVYSATGTWTASWMNPAGESDIFRLQLEDSDGLISGSWEAGFFANFDSGPVSGTRTFAAVDLSLEFECGDYGYCPPNPLIGEFTDSRTIAGYVDVGFFLLPVTLERD